MYVRILSVESWRHFEGVSHCPRGRGSLSYTTLTWYNEQVADNSTATPLKCNFFTDSWPEVDRALESKFYRSRYEAIFQTVHFGDGSSAILVHPFI